MIYDHFAFSLEGGGTWFKIGEGYFHNFHVESVDNPTPEPKYDYLDISGTSGGIDLTESNGRVFFKNKTVTVVIGAQTTPEIMQEIQQYVLSGFNGRRVWFTFDDSANYRFQVGRAFINFDLKEHHITFTFENVEAFRYSEPEIAKTLTVLANYERDVNTAAWTLGSISGGGGELSVANDVNGGFVYFDSEAGAIFERIKPASGNNGKYLAFGIVSIVGGDVWFEWTDNGQTVKSRTTAKVVDGTITMMCSIDGSYYEWRNVDGVRKYVPSIRCSYVFTDYLPMSGGDLTSAVSMNFPSNVIIRPLVRTFYAAGYIICDGVVVPTTVSPDKKYLPRLALAGDRADLENYKAKSVFAIIPKTAGGQPQTTLWFREAEVF